MPAFRCQECGALFAPRDSGETLCGGRSCVLRALSPRPSGEAERDAERPLPAIAFVGGVVTEDSDAYRLPPIDAEDLAAVLFDWFDERPAQGEPGRSSGRPNPRAARDGCRLPGVDLCWFRMPAHGDWFSSMVQLSLIRKQLVARHIIERRRICHLTVLAFRSFSLFVVNQRTSAGGTTHLLWPIGGEQVDGGQVDAVRVLDLSPREAHHLVAALSSSGIYSDESELARYMLDVVRGELRLPVTRPVQLRFRSSFLKHVKQDGALLGFTSPDWRLSSKTGWKQLPPVTHHQAICYLLAILLLADPRQGPAGWPAVLRALELVRDGALSFEQLFGSLGGKASFGKRMPSGGERPRAPGRRPTALAADGPPDREAGGAVAIAGMRRTVRFVQVADRPTQAPRAPAIPSDTDM